MQKADSRAASPQRQLLYPEESPLVRRRDTTRGRGRAFLRAASNSLLWLRAAALSGSIIAAAGAETASSARMTVGLSIPPYNWWGSVAEVTCHLQGPWDKRWGSVAEVTCHLQGPSLMG
jgi:hypothetical protein